MKTFSEILKEELAIKNFICGLKKQLIEEIKITPIIDTKPITQNITIIKFSQIQNNVWSPEYYLPSAQAQFIEKALEHIQSAYPFILKLKSIIEDHKVKIGLNFYAINDTTISILKKYV